MSGNLYTRGGGPAPGMRQVKLDQDELRQIKELYEGVMSHACHGLFFKEGSVLGAPMAEAALKDRAHYFERAGQELKERGWVTESSSPRRRSSSTGRSRSLRATFQPATASGASFASSTNVLRGGALNARRRCVRAPGHPECRFHVEEL